MLFNKVIDGFKCACSVLIVSGCPEVSVGRDLVCSHCFFHIGFALYNFTWIIYIESIFTTHCEWLCSRKLFSFQVYPLWTIQYGLLNRRRDYARLHFLYFHQDLIWETPVDAVGLPCAAGWYGPPLRTLAWFFMYNLSRWWDVTLLSKDATSKIKQFCEVLTCPGIDGLSLFLRRKIIFRFWKEGSVIVFSHTMIGRFDAFSTGAGSLYTSRYSERHIPQARQRHEIALTVTYGQ